MKPFFSFKHNPFLAIWVIFFLLIVYMFIHMQNGRFVLWDFLVYYRAAERILPGENLYQIVSDGHFIFKYSPVSALYFIPLSWLPLGVAKVIYWVASAVAFGGVLVLFFRMGGRREEPLSAGRQNLLYLLAFIIMGAWLELEIHLGQVNIFILLLLVLSAWFSEKGKPLTAGLMLALSIFLKPFGLILAVWYLYRHRFREVMYFLGFAILLFFIPVFFYGSFGMFFEQCGLWVQEMKTELGNKQDLLAQFNHTVFSVLVRYTPLRWINWTPALTMAYQLIMLVVIAFLFIRLGVLNRKDTDLFPVELALLLSLIPFLAFTNKNLFLCTGMVHAILMMRFNRLSLPCRILFIFGVMISSFNIIEIWGEPLTKKLEAWSLISVGTIINWLVLYVHTSRTLKRV